MMTERELKREELVKETIRLSGLGLSCVEIARMLGLSESTIRSVKKISVDVEMNEKTNE